jgi:hypothetical protein
MRKAKGLAKLVEMHRPNTSIELCDVGKFLVVGFRSDTRRLWVALEGSYPNATVDEALGMVADAFACCDDCEVGLECQCRREHRSAAARLRGFLGEEGFQALLERAPSNVPSQAG